MAQPTKEKTEFRDYYKDDPVTKAVREHYRKMQSCSLLCRLAVYVASQGSSLAPLLKKTTSSLRAPVGSARAGSRRLRLQTESTSTS